MSDSNPHQPTNASILDDQDAALAAHLDMELGDAPPIETGRELVAQLTSKETDPLLEALFESLLELTTELQARVDDLEGELETTHEIATTASGKTAQNAAAIEDLEAEQEKTHDIAKTAVAKAQQLEADPDAQEDAEALPAGVEPSSSPLDFFANCREAKCKELFVEQSNRQNTYRAIKIAKRWPEFATERTDGSGVFFDKEAVTMALTAELGEKPHRQTVSRVWDKLVELGGADLRVKSRQVGRRQEPTELLVMDRATADGLLEKRYLGLDLLEKAGAEAGGVTPVVTRERD